MNNNKSVKEAAGARTNESVENGTGALDSGLSRKELKKREAEFRQSVAPLKKRIQKGEKEMEQHQNRLEELETLLADTSLYESQNKDKLKTLLAEQGSLTSLLEECEMIWLEAQEELEIAENEFRKTVGA